MKHAKAASESTKHIQTWQFRLRWIRSLKAWQCTWETKQQLSRTKASTHTQVRKSCTHLAEVKRLELEANTRGPTPYVALISSRSACEYQLMVGKECERVQPCWVSPWSAILQGVWMSSSVQNKSHVSIQQTASKQQILEHEDSFLNTTSDTTRAEGLKMHTTAKRSPREHQCKQWSSQQTPKQTQDSRNVKKSSSYLMMISQQLDNNPTQTKTGWLDGSQTAFKGFPQFK